MPGIPISEIGKCIVYRPPSHARNPFGMYFKHPSYFKGEYPEQLKPYRGKIAHCAKECGTDRVTGRGKHLKGQAYRLCLKACALREFGKMREAEEIARRQAGVEIPG